MSIKLDIETEPKPLVELELIMPKFEAAKNIKDSAKIAADIEKKKASFIEKAALNPLTGTVQAYGIYDGECYQSFDVNKSNEAVLLADLWQRLTHQDAFKQSIIGWNLNGFDLPFLIKRSWANRVKVPQTAIEIYRGRSYLNGRFIDLMSHFCVGSTDRFMKLNEALSLLGLPPKADLDGKLPYEIFEADPQGYHEYLRRDVMALDEISNIVGL